jgi:hypothetical protein
MLDFTPVRQKEITLNELVAGLEREDLARLTNEMIDQMVALIAACTDEDVVFEPVDPDAHDPAAESADEVQMSWTLGHIIVHTTASAEESAFLAVNLARGVAVDARSRYEVPWQTVTTIAQCRHRLEESRRMRLATLAAWPDQPHMDNVQFFGRRQTPLNPAARFVSGLWHDADHLNQLAEVVRQARVARLELAKPLPAGD